MPRDNRCMYMAHVCFYVCCSDCVGVCGNVCCEVTVVKNSVFRWCRWGVGRGIGPGSGAVGWCYVCVRCESGFSV